MKELPILPKRPDGWWIDASRETPDVPEWGPYDTKDEVSEARASYLRSKARLEGRAETQLSLPIGDDE